MKLTIIGDGVFGSFLKELLSPHFDICDDANSVILAVPFSAYAECGKNFKDKHLINVCSVQKPSTDILLKHTEKVTSIHPLFGKRTPTDKRNSILTYTFTKDNDTWFQDETEQKFLEMFAKVSNISYGVKEMYGDQILAWTPEEHDRLMAKTHAAAVMAAKQLKVFVDRAKDVPDEFIPNSFRLMREFVKTLDDMPIGTVESIMANPFI
jgi:prephenate dehydrogenase